MPVQAALAEFGLPGQWAAPSCGQPFVVLTFESSPTSQFVIRRDKDGARFDITSATNQTIFQLELRTPSSKRDGRHVRASDKSSTYAFGKRGNNLVSPWAESASARRACRCVRRSAPRWDHSTALPAARHRRLHRDRRRCTRCALSSSSSDFLLHDEQTTACCSISYVARPANSDALMKELVRRSHDGHSDCYHETTLRRECVGAGAI